MMSIFLFWEKNWIGGCWMLDVWTSGDVEMCNGRRKRRGLLDIVCIGEIWIWFEVI